MIHLVTGSSGFLGQALARRLLAAGETVRHFDVLENPEHDVCNRDAVRRSMPRIDFVHHLAALVPLAKAGNRFYEVNSLGSVNVARVASEMNVKFLIYLSSSTVFGLAKSPITDHSPIMPIENYGNSKFDGECACRIACVIKGIPFLAIRPRTIIGPGRLGIFQLLFDWISKDKPVFMLGDGLNKFQFIHVDDFLDAYLMLMDNGETGCWNVGTDRFGTMRQAMENLIAHAGSKSKLVGLPVAPAKFALKVLSKAGLIPLAPWHYLSYAHPFYFDVNPLLNIGWKPKYSNDEALAEAYDWYIENREQLKQQKGSIHRSKVKQGVLGWLT